MSCPFRRRQLPAWGREHARWLRAGGRPQQMAEILFWEETSAARISPALQQEVCFCPAWDDNREAAGLEPRQCCTCDRCGSDGGRFRAKSGLTERRWNPVALLK